MLRRQFGVLTLVFLLPHFARAANTDRKVITEEVAWAKTNELCARLLRPTPEFKAPRTVQLVQSLSAIATKNSTSTDRDWEDHDEVTYDFERRIRPSFVAGHFTLENSIVAHFEDGLFVTIRINDGPAPGSGEGNGLQVRFADDDSIEVIVGAVIAPANPESNPADIVKLSKKIDDRIFELHSQIRSGIMAQKSTVIGIQSLQDDPDLILYESSARASILRRTVRFNVKDGLTASQWLPIINAILDPL